MGIFVFPDFPFSVSDTIALAATTAAALAAIATAWQAREVRRTVQEQREDRRLAYQPYLDVYADDASPTGWFVHNVGRGIALKCAVFTWIPANDQGYSPMMVLGEKERKAFEPWPIAPGAARADDIFEPFPHTHRLDVAICEDELGNLHRFGPAAAHDEWPRGHDNGRGWAEYRRFFPRL